MVKGPRAGRRADPERPTGCPLAEFRAEIAATASCGVIGKTNVEVGTGLAPEQMLLERPLPLLDEFSQREQTRLMEQLQEKGLLEMERVTLEQVLPQLQVLSGLKPQRVQGEHAEKMVREYGGGSDPLRTWPGAPRVVRRDGRRHGMMAA